MLHKFQFIHNTCGALLWMEEQNCTIQKDSCIVIAPQKQFLLLLSKVVKPYLSIYIVHIYGDTNSFFLCPPICNFLCFPNLPLNEVLLCVKNSNMICSSFTSKCSIVNFQD